MVAGTAALLKQLGTLRRFDDLETMAQQTAVDIRDQNPGIDEDAWGAGMLDIAAAVAWEGPCYADLTDNDVLDLADLQAFIQRFQMHDESVDFVVPRGVWDLADLQFFIGSFVSGCP